MPYVAPKDFINALIMLIRAWGTEPLASAVVRKGTTRSIRLASGQKCFVMVELDQMPEGEAAAGSNNRWWNEWTCAVKLGVVDDETEACEDMRLDLIEEFSQLLHANRTIGGAKVIRASAAAAREYQMLEPKELFRGAEITVQYRTLRG